MPIEFKLTSTETKLHGQSYGPSLHRASETANPDILLRRALEATHQDVDLSFTFRVEKNSGSKLSVACPFIGELLQKKYVGSQKIKIMYINFQLGDLTFSSDQITTQECSALVTSLTSTLNTLRASYPHMTIIVNVQGDKGVVHKTLEELMRQLAVKGANHAALERHVHDQAGPPGQIDDDT